jgi:hypothetical protein
LKSLDDMVCAMALLRANKQAAAVAMQLSSGRGFFMVIPLG